MLRSCGDMSRWPGGVDALTAATDGLLASAPREAAASAVPYLKLCGVVIGGWLMARAARGGAAYGAATTLGLSDAQF